MNSLEARPQEPFRRRFILVATLLAFSSGGCSSTITLMTLADGEKLYVREEMSLFGAKSRIAGVCDVQGNLREVRARPVGGRNCNFYGYDVRQVDDRVTVWYVDRRKRVPLAAIHVDREGRRWTLPFVPRRNTHFGESRLACHVRRQVFHERLTCCTRLTVDCESLRDTHNTDKNSDALHLSLEHRHRSGLFRSRMTRHYLKATISQAVDSVSDPFVGSPALELRRDKQGKGAWIVDVSKGKVLAGVRLDTPKLFPADEAPPWAVADAGIVVAATSPRR